MLEDAKKKIQGAAMAAMQKAVELAPDNWVPGGRPDTLIREEHDYIGKPVARLDGPLKVKGAATCAAEVTIDGMVYAALAYSAIAKGRIAAIEQARPKRHPAWCSS